MGKSALIVVDVQNFYMNEHTKNLPEKISKFIEDNTFDFVLFTKFINNEQSSLSRHLNWNQCSSPPDTDIVKSLSKFAKRNNTFEKNTYSAFKLKAFSKFLQDNSVTDMYFCGLDIDACILASAYEAFDLGYRTRVLSKLTLSHCGKTFEENALRIINKNIQPDTM